MSALTEPPTTSPSPSRKPQTDPGLQTTIRTEITVSGIGMHTGKECRVTLRPAPPGSSVRFVAGPVSIPALTESVSSTRRCTCLESGETRVSTVEHLLSAIAGVGIDNLEIDVVGGEIPILDGSALSWTRKLVSAGIHEQEAPRRLAALARPAALSLDDSWMVAVPADELTITCVTRFDHPMLGTEVVTYRHSPQAYLEEVAPARTFGFIEEVEQLLAAGLAQGGSLENALVIYPDRFSDAQRVPHECNRHKLLDLIGDLSLAGVRFNAAITAVKPSHRANVEFARVLPGYLAVPGEAPTE